jgi:hypothetical protein
MSAQSTTETYITELPSDRRKVRYIHADSRRRYRETRAQARKGCIPEELEHKLDVGETSNKPRRIVVTERVSLRDGRNSLVISCLGTGVARVLRMNSSEPMVGWKGAHPQSVTWMKPVIDKYSHTL